MGKYATGARYLRRLDRRDIEIAMSRTLSNKAAAKYLGVTYPTYKKYASMFKNEDGVTLFDAHKNVGAVGIPRYSIRRNKQTMLEDILFGRVKDFGWSLKNLKRTILEEGYLEEVCARCGHSERRKLDYKAPLILHFKNGDKKNWALGNLEFLCYNCYFISISDLFEKAQLDSLEYYTTLQSKSIDFDLPKEHEEKIKESVNLQNNYIAEIVRKEEDFGDDLISFIKPKR